VVVAVVVSTEGELHLVAEAVAATVAEVVEM